MLVSLIRGLNLLVAQLACLPNLPKTHLIISTNLLVQGTWKIIDSKIYEESCGI
jgi:hypothetical protein